jgi:hypothetical protein
MTVVTIVTAVTVVTVFGASRKKCSFNLDFVKNRSDPPPQKFWIFRDILGHFSHISRISHIQYI